MSKNDLHFVIPEGQAGRVDQIVGSRYPAASRRRLADLFTNGQVRVDGKKVKKGQFVQAGQHVELSRPPIDDESLRVCPEAGELALVYEDEHLLVINKPPGLPSHPLLAGELGTVANMLVHRHPECAMVGEDPREAGLAHRLDIHTSGLLLAARDAHTWQALREAFAQGNIDKTYLAAVHERPFGDECQEPLLQKSRKVSVDYSGLEAHTTWQVLAHTEEYSFLRCKAHTGRMHQVRAHLAHCGSPIVGDTLYGGQSCEDFVGHFLHASQISFTHPHTGEHLDVRAPLPALRAAWLDAVGLSVASSE